MKTKNLYLVMLILSGILALPGVGIFASLLLFLPSIALAVFAVFDMRARKSRGENISQPRFALISALSTTFSVILIYVSVLFGTAFANNDSLRAVGNIMLPLGFFFILVSWFLNIIVAVGYYQQYSAAKQDGAK